MTSTMIPIYIQKKIYKYLIILELDKSEHESYELNAQVIKKFSTLSWEWFNFVSSKIYHTLIITEYNKPPIKSSDNNNRYLLRKPDSIKYLKLVSLSKLNVDIINSTISALPSLKWITSEHNNDKFSMIKFSNFRINSLLLYRHDSNDVPPYINRIDLLHIQESIPTEKILKTFNQTKIYGFTTHCRQNHSQFSIFRFPFKQLYQRKLNKDVVDELPTITILNRLQWLRTIKIPVLTVKSLYQFLKASPKLKDATFGICFHNLIYRLHIKYSNNYDAYEKNSLQPCECSKVIENCKNQDDDTIDEIPLDSSGRIIHELDLFSYYWSEISTLVSNHKHLSSLSIKNKCYKNVRFDDRQDDDVNPLIGAKYSKSVTVEQVQHFIQSFSNMISNNRSIRSVNFDTSNCVILESLVNSLLQSDSNSNITNYSFTSPISTSFDFDSLRANYLKNKNLFKDENILSFKIFDEDLPTDPRFGFQKKL